METLGGDIKEKNEVESRAASSDVVAAVADADAAAKVEEPAVAAVEERPSPTKSVAFKLAFIGLGFTMFVFQFDALALGIALPTIAADLDGTALESFWASLCYLLCVVVTTPIWVSGSEVLGRKAPLYVSMAFFAVGSIVFAVAQDMGTLIAGRVLQGVGGGGINVLIETIVTDMTTLKERAFWLGMMGLPVASGNILGLPISAVLTAFASWRWLGWINLPILGVGFPLVFFFLRLRSLTSEHTWAGLREFDWLGMALYIAGVVVFVMPLSWAGTLFAWGSWRTIFPLVLGILLLIGFAVYEAYPKFPIAPRRIYKNKTAAMSLLGAFFHGNVMFMILQYLPLFYQAIPLDSVVNTAVLILAASILSVFSSVLAMVTVGLTGMGYRLPIQIAWILMAVGTGLLALLDPTSSRATYIGIPIIYSIGLASLRLLILPIEASVKDVNDTGVAVSQLLTIRLLGGVTGLAIASTAFNSVFASSISKLGPLTGPLAPLNHASDAIAEISQLRKLHDPPAVIGPVLDAYLDAFRTIWYIGTAFGGLGLITSFFMKNISLQRTDVGQQHFEESRGTGAQVPA